MTTDKQKFILNRNSFFVFQLGEFLEESAQHFIEHDFAGELANQ